jgi:hypothetical protein
MDTRKLIIPALALIAGAVVGRLVGLKTIAAGLMTGVALARAGRPLAGALAPARSRSAPVRRAARKPQIQRKGA